MVVRHPPPPEPKLRVSPRRSRKQNKSFARKEKYNLDAPEHDKLKNAPISNAVDTMQQVTEHQALKRQKGSEYHRTSHRTQKKSQLLNEDFCWSCRGAGVFICCDACPRSFHFLCTNPPEEETIAAQPSSWFCRACLSKRKKPRKERRESSNLKAALKEASRRLACENPRVFSLSDTICGAFANVARDSAGNFVDLDEYRSASARTIRWNPDDLYGLPMLPLAEDVHQRWTCHGCGGSAIHGPLIECDFCSFSWHLDCLNPPLCSSPAVGKKWLCPLHIRHFTLQSPRRKLESETVEIYSNSTLGLPLNDEVEVIVSSEGMYKTPNDKTLHQALTENETFPSRTEKRPTHSRQRNAGHFPLPVPSTTRVVKVSLKVPDYCITNAFTSTLVEEKKLDEIVEGPASALRLLAIAALGPPVP